MAVGASKNKKKKERKKARAAAKREEEAKRQQQATAQAESNAAANNAEDDIKVQWVSESVELPDPELKAAFGNMFDAFTKAEVLTESPEERAARLKAEAQAKEKAEKAAAEAAKAEEEGEDDKKKEEEEEVDSSDEEDDDGENKISKKQRKKLYRLKVSQLKQLVPRPDVVEVWDVTAADPRLLVHLKSYRNTVPVPKHWCQKRKYLQNKRGSDKKAYQLPDFIQATGIGKIREALQEKEDAKKSKQKNREKLAPKMGKVDIDYQVLHDAFFRFQTKPKLSKLGDLYYENKELETRCDARPTILSEELKRAVGMQAGAPPPWVVKMQIFGPPPSYPNLKIPGVNAPIPAGAQWGTQAGGWGNPPVNQFGQGLWGDIFGSNQEAALPGTEAAAIERNKFGELEEEEFSESESDSSDEDSRASGDEGEGDEDMQSGITSVATSGMHTPAVLELRKGAPGQQQPPSAPGPLFQVLEQKQQNVSSNMMGSAHGYVVPPAGAAAAAAPAAKGKSRAGVDLMKSQATEKVNITLDADELGNVDELTLKQRFEEGLREQQGGKLPGGSGGILAVEKEDGTARKRKGTTKESSKKKKQKEFKF